MVIVLTPSCAAAEAVSRSELAPAVGFAMVGGVKRAVTPGGNPVTVNFSAPAKPLDAVVPSAIATMLLRASVAETEPAVSLNPPTTTVTTTVGAGETPLLVPITVIG